MSAKALSRRLTVLSCAQAVISCTPAEEIADIKHKIIETVIFCADDKKEPLFCVQPMKHGFQKGGERTHT